MIDVDVIVFPQRACRAVVVERYRHSGDADHTGFTRHLNGHVLSGVPRTVPVGRHRASPDAVGLGASLLHERSLGGRAGITPAILRSGELPRAEYSVLTAPARSVADCKNRRDQSRGYYDTGHSASNVGLVPRSRPWRRPARELPPQRSRITICKRRACLFLLDALSCGPRRVAEVAVAAHEARIAPSPLRRAKERLGVRSVKLGLRAGWAWTLFA